MLIIKQEPELQHVLAHVLRAVQFVSQAAEALARGDQEQAMPLCQAALYESASIEGLVTWNDDDEFVSSFTNVCKEGDKHGLPKENEG